VTARLGRGRRTRASQHMDVNVQCVSACGSAGSACELAGVLLAWSELCSHPCKSYVCSACACRARTARLAATCACARVNRLHRAVCVRACVHARKVRVCSVCACQAETVIGCSNVCMCAIESAGVCAECVRALQLCVCNLGTRYTCVVLLLTSRR